MAGVYCGAVGKRANCQVAVSVHAATDAASCPLHWQLFLSEEWTGDPARCRAAGVPDGTGHREERRPAVDLLDELAAWESAEPFWPVYGGLAPPTLLRYRTPHQPVSRLAAGMEGSGFTEVTWREGSKGPMTSRFGVLG
ncbi:transposase [Streptomyces sp. NPDC008001]|uniref:transposase n=1 Tax=Streptomyces sp. NPDC008001 TaxID=3364804 RepID=UPI0036E1A360